MAIRGKVAIADGGSAAAGCAVLRIPRVGGLRLLHATRDQGPQPWTDRSPHRHELWHAVAYTSGAGSCLLGDEVVAVSAPFLVLTSPGQLHSFASLPGETAIYSEITFVADPSTRSLPGWPGLLAGWTGEECALPSATACAAACADDVASIAGRMATVIHGGHPQAGVLLQGLLSELLFSIFRHLVAERERQLPHDPIEQARRFIEAHAEDPIDLGVVAKAAGLSAKHLGRAFATRFGDPPMRYRQRVLMRRAAVLLRTSDAPVERLAAGLGFDDWRYFSRCFRAEHGVPPAAYRRG